MSGYSITIRAFLPCGTDSAGHVQAHQIIAVITKSVLEHGFVDVAVTDKYLPNRKSAPPVPAERPAVAEAGDNAAHAAESPAIDLTIPAELRR